MPINAKVYECIDCNFKCSKQSNYNQHINTRKHNLERNGNLWKQKNATCTVCSKIFKTASGLWKHKKKCNVEPQLNIGSNEDIQPTPFKYDTTDVVLQLLTQNQEFKKLIIEQQQENQKQQQENQKLHIESQKLQSQLIEAVKDGGNTINNNNTTNNNQKFNLNFFLNTTCKDALNMSEFIENMEIGFKDIENIGKNGYVSGMTDMILSRIKELDVTKRPLHCTDLKRETMYIKDNDEWCKDTPENSKLHQTIKCVAKRNYATIPLWRENYPECQDWNHPKYDFCVDMMRNILGDIGDEQTKLDNKVIRNLSKHIVVNKS
jgi:hypothetical protein